VDEAPFWIAVNGQRRAVLSCTAGGSESLAAGYLIGEGWVASAAEIDELVTEAGPGGSSGVRVTVPPGRVAQAAALLEHQMAHGCGLRHFLDCGDQAPTVSPGGPPADRLPEAFRDLFAAADAASPAGGVHAAALFDGASLRHGAVDVARHCAVDRAIGAGALADADLPRLGLLLTSRISAAMVLKAARARLPWIASRSVATPLARELAAAAGLVIHQNAARRAEPGSRRGADPARGPAAE
jgi:FdhD protein